MRSFGRAQVRGTVRLRVNAFRIGSGSRFTQFHLIFDSSTRCLTPPPVWVGWSQGRDRPRRGPSLGRRGHLSQGADCAVTHQPTDLPRRSSPECFEDREAVHTSSGASGLSWTLRRPATPAARSHRRAATPLLRAVRFPALHSAS